MDRKSGRLSLLCSIIVFLAMFLSICLSSSATETNSPIQGPSSPIFAKTDYHRSHQNVTRRSPIGSRRPNCVGVCRGCTLCKSKLVRRLPRAEDDPPYYPMVWRCKRGGKAYRPRNPTPATHSSLGHP